MSLDQEKQKSNIFELITNHLVELHPSQWLTEDLGPLLLHQF